MSLGIQVASLAYKLQHKQLQNNALKSLVSSLSRADSIHAIMEAIRSHVRDVLGSARAACFLVDEDMHQVWTPASADCPNG